VIARWEPPFVQKTPPHTPVKFGIKGSDDNIVWHEYISEEKSTSCKQLAFVEDPDSMAKLIRDSVWQAGKSNLSDKFVELFQGSLPTSISRWRQIPFTPRTLSK
jgi:hypothetical protein